MITKNFQFILSKIIFLSFFFLSTNVVFGMDNQEQIAIYVKQTEYCKDFFLLNEEGTIINQTYTEPLYLFYSDDEAKNTKIINNKIYLTGTETDERQIPITPQQNEYFIRSKTPIEGVIKITYPTCKIPTAEGHISFTYNNSNNNHSIKEKSPTNNGHNEISKAFKQENKDLSPSFNAYTVSVLTAIILIICIKMYQSLS